MDRTFGPVTLTATPFSSHRAEDQWAVTASLPGETVMYTAIVLATSAAGALRYADKHRRELFPAKITKEMNDQCPEQK